MQPYDKHELFRCRVNRIVDAHEERNRELDREGARLAWWTCPAIALVFGAIAWVQFSQAEVGLGVIYTVGALVFLGMLVVVLRRAK